MARLTAAKRKRLKTKSFGLPKVRGFPLNDLAHARAALSRLKFASPQERLQIIRKIARKFPAFAKRSAKVQSILGRKGQRTQKQIAAARRNLARARAARRRIRR